MIEILWYTSLFLLTLVLCQYCIDRLCPLPKVQDQEKAKDILQKELALFSQTAPNIIIAWDENKSPGCTKIDTNNFMLRLNSRVKRHVVAHEVYHVFDPSLNWFWNIKNKISDEINEINDVSLIRFLVILGKITFLWVIFLLFYLFWAEPRATIYQAKRAKNLRKERTTTS